MLGIHILGLRKNHPDFDAFHVTGTIYLRTAKAPVNLSDKLVLRHVEEKEKEAVLRPVVTDFAATFSLDVEECLSGDFIAIEADKSKTYSQLYAAV